MTYFNTNLERGNELKKASKKALAQEDNILAWAKLRGYQFTAEDALQDLFMNKIPMTSVRRAISVLLSKGKIKIVGQEVGMYGKKIFTYSCVD